MSASSELRTTPKQQRSEQRIEEILDVAEQLFAAEGFDAVSTNYIAETAGMAVGSLYRYFPDKSAIASSLADRHVKALDDLYAQVVIDDLSLPLPLLLDQVLTPLTEYWRAHPVVATLLRLATAGGVETRIDALYTNLVERVEVVMAAWVPGIPAREKNITAQSIVAIARALFFEVRATTERDRRLFLAELKYVLIAYISSKYPGPDSKLWSDPDAVPVPVRPAIA